MKRSFLTGFAISTVLILTIAAGYKTVMVDSDNKLIAPTKTVFFTSNGISSYSMTLLEITNLGTWQSTLGISNAPTSTNSAQYYMSDTLYTSNLLVTGSVTASKYKLYNGVEGATTNVSISGATFAYSEGLLTNLSGAYSGSTIATMLSNTAPIYVKTAASQTNTIFNTNYNSATVPWMLNQLQGNNVFATYLTNGCMEYWKNPNAIYEYDGGSGGSDWGITQSTDAYEGSYSCIISNKTGYSGLRGLTAQIYDIANTQVRPGAIMTVSFWYKGNGVNKGRYQIWIGRTGTPGTDLTGVCEVPTASTNWLQFSYRYLLPADTRTIWLIMSMPTASGAWVKVDDARCYIDLPPLEVASGQSNLFTVYNTNLWWNKRPVAQTDTNDYFTATRLLISALGSGAYGKVLSYSSNGIIASSFSTNGVRFGADGSSVVVGNETSTNGVDNKYNVYVGLWAGKNVVSSNNVGVGFLSLAGDPVSSSFSILDNTALGPYAFEFMTNCHRSVAVGYSSGIYMHYPDMGITNLAGYLKSSSHNTFLGAYTGTTTNGIPEYSTALGAGSCVEGNYTVAINGGYYVGVGSSPDLITNRSFVLNGVKTYAQMSILGADGLNVGATNAVGQGIIRALGYKSSDGSAGITTNVTISGTTLTIKNGIITGVSY